MALISFKYDWKDGELMSGVLLMRVKDIKILGRRLRNVIWDVGRADRTEGLKGGGVEMLIIEYQGKQYGNIEMEVEELTAICKCPPVFSECHTGICLDECLLQLNNCCLTLN